MITQAALVFGIILLALGAMGFIPLFTPAGNLLGIFAVDTPHNLIHLISGAVAIMTSFVSTRAAQLYFKVFGIIYGLIAILGFLLTPTGGQLFGVMVIDLADNLLHVGIAALALYFGFAVRERHQLNMASTTGQ